MTEQQPTEPTYHLYGRTYPYTARQVDMLTTWRERVDEVLTDDMEAVVRQLVRLGVPAAEARGACLEVTAAAVRKAASQPL